MLENSEAGYTVYVLYSPSANNIYVGFTRELKNRMLWHNHKSKKGYTKNFRPWQVIYTEVFILELEARLREKALKSQKGREFIWNLISKKKELSAGSSSVS